MTKIEQIQEILGVAIDNRWGPKSQAALDAAIAASRMPVEASEPVVAVNPPTGASEAFLAFMPFIFKWEGEYYENDPDDPGGATKYGIDQRSHPGVDIKSLTKEAALAIYWKEWQEAGCEGYTTPFAEVFFNCRVNMGLGRAREFNSNTHLGLDSRSRAKMFLDLQEAKYRSIAANNRGLAKFLKGWLNRTTALRERFGL